MIAIPEVIALLAVLLAKGADASAAENNDSPARRRPWNLNEFPLAHADECRTPVSGRGCDPDEVFSDQEWHIIDQALATNTPTMRVYCDATDEKNNANEPAVTTVQMAVAIAGKVSLLIRLALMPILHNVTPT